MKSILNFITEKHIEEFWSKVTKTEHCWEWTGTKTKGYGRFEIRNSDFRYQARAHRISYTIHHNIELDSNLNVCHKCDNPSCVRPEHLFLGTQKENVRDMINKGRFASKEQNGELNNKSKLTNIQVDEIRDFLKNNSHKKKDIAKLYGVSPQCISDIYTGKRRS